MSRRGAPLDSARHHHSMETAQTWATGQVIQGFAASYLNAEPAD